MTSFESNNSNASEANGIHLEIMLPDVVILPIPENQPDANTPIRFGISVTNNTSNPFVFTQYRYLIPELVGRDGQTLERQKFEDETLQSEGYDCTLIMPGERMVFGIEAKLSWQDNKLQFSSGSGLNYSWFFDAIKPGTYQLRFIYDSPSQLIQSYDKETGEEDLASFYNDDDSESPVSTPESTSALGLLALSSWGIIKALKIREKATP